MKKLPVKSIAEIIQDINLVLKEVEMMQNNSKSQINPLLENTNSLEYTNQPTEDIKDVSYSMQNKLQLIDDFLNGKAKK